MTGCSAMFSGTRLCSAPSFAILYVDMQIESDTMRTSISSSLISGSSNSSMRRSIAPCILTALVFMLATFP